MAGNDLAMFADATRGPCGVTDGGEFHAGFIVLDTGPYRFTTIATFDTVVYVRDGNGCSGPSLGCDDASGDGGDVLELALTAGQEIVVTVDAAVGVCGSIRLRYQGV